MSNSAFDIYQFVLLDHESLGLPSIHARALQLFRDTVVRRSLQAIDHEIEKTARSEDPGAVFFESDLADLFQSTVEGYLLTVQSMWERELRKLLVRREKRLCGGAKVTALQNALWSNDPKGLQSHFERLFASPMTAFDSYEDLDLLQNLGNAIRHGDGPSAVRLHKLAPGLWRNWIAPGETIQAGPFTIMAPADAPTHPSFDLITMRGIVLEQMILSVIGFWSDLEYVRCNSFRNKHESVVRMLQAWPAERLRRKNTRVWTAAPQPL